MELPQLKLYLRRVLATPSGLPLREALRTARVRALLAVLGWTVAATLTLWAVSLIYQDASISRDPISNWLENGGAQLLIAGCTLAGVWYLLFLPAEQMASLARQSKSAQPDWYTAPLGSMNAVLSTLLAAMVAALPAAVGLGLYIAFTSGFAADLADHTAWAAPSSGLVDGLVHGLSFGAFGLLLLYLPAYLLFVGCLSLALRELSWGSYIPALTALTGTAVTQGFRSTDSYPPAIDSYLWVLLALVLLVLAAATVTWMARRPTSLVAGTSAMLILIGLPFLSVVTSASADTLSNLTGNDLLRYSGCLQIPTYALATVTYPVPDTRVINANGELTERLPRKSSDEVTVLLGMRLLYLVGHLLILGVWWMSCVEALNAARNLLRPRRERARLRASSRFPGAQSLTG